MPMIVAFHSNQLGFRGTERALFDYARYNEEVLGNKSVIISASFRDVSSVKKFSERFPVHLYESPSVEELNYLLLKSKAEFFYSIKSGLNDGFIPTECKSGVHCVFDTTQKHGTVYATISDYLNLRHRTQCPVVPHVVEDTGHKQDLRKELGIPSDVIVFGRHGGLDQFDVPYARHIVKEIVGETAGMHRSDIWFLFLNTKQFVSSPRVIYLPASFEQERVQSFVNTCDGMLHGRSDGESFGLSIAEFAIRNKPVISWRGGDFQAHLQLLTNGIWYENQTDLREIFRNISKSDIKNGNWLGYTGFDRNSVMKTFKEVFF